MNAREHTESRIAAPHNDAAFGEKLEMLPTQAASCLKAAAKLMSAAWVYQAYDAHKVNPAIIVQALDIMETVASHMNHFREQASSAESSRDELIAARIAYETAQIAYLKAKLRVLVNQQKHLHSTESDAPVET